MNLPVSWDDRRFCERLRRVQLYEVCQKFSVPYQQGATAIAMRDSLKAHNVTDAQVIQYFETKGKLQVVEGMDEHGKQHRELYPVQETHQSARFIADGGQIDYDAAIAENAAKVAEKDEVIEEQSGVMNELLEMVSGLKTEIENMKKMTLPMEKMTPPQLKGMAKRLGIDVKGLRTRDELVAAINENST